MNKQYRLKKDIQTPITFVKAGTIFTKANNEDKYLDNDGLISCSSGYVENNPEWFEEVQEKRWTDSDMIAFGELLLGRYYSHPSFALIDFKKEYDGVE